MKAHLIKGSAAAKAYMAKLRSKKTKVGAVKKKAAPKKKVGAVKKKAVSKKKVVKIKGLSKAKSLQKDLKSKGLKLTKGYDLQKRKRIGSMPTFKDPDTAREIELYADNDSRLYFSRKLPIIKNLYRKFKKGTFKIDLAAKLWIYYINDAMQRYNAEFGSPRSKWHDLLSVPDRKLLAFQYAEEILAEFENGSYDDSLLK